jgi:cytochrome c peroxidase
MMGLKCKVSSVAQAPARLEYAKTSQCAVHSSPPPFFNWDGRHDTLWGQAAGVMESPVEFNAGRLFVATHIFERYRREYEEIFSDLRELEEDARFPRLLPTEEGCEEITRITAPEYVCRGKPGDGAEYNGMATEDKTLVTEIIVNAGKALAAYLSQLRCGLSRFDAWFDGDQRALMESEIRGAELFVGEAKCSDCHSGPRLSEGLFHDVGRASAVVAAAFTDEK